MKHSTALSTFVARGAWPLSVLAAAAIALMPVRPAHACGGLFCNSSQPVNQAAERIIFADNGDGTVTAIIEVQYSGPAPQFAWVLPVPGVPEVDVSSVAALDRLQQRTNPQYTLNVNFECDVDLGAGIPRGQGTSAPNGFANDGGESDGPAVNVLASGSVGPFNYDVIMVNPELSDRAEPALEWLMDNGYDVTDLGPEVLRPYLDEDLNLIAFKLDKSASTGSIRPIRISYDGKKPFIPIRPTAVAANDDMGIMVFVLGESRAIPREYKALEINEARINWFNPMSTYDDVVSEAADEASGQGFVTEIAGSTDMLDQVVVQQWERDQWRDFQSRTFSDPIEMFLEAQNQFYNWEGFDDALRASVMLPVDLSLEDFSACLRCYAGREDVVIDETELLTQIFERVIQPMFATQDLLDSQRYVTRLYTTMSADEMTVDPSFDFNDELDDVDNIHTADQFIGCGDEWRVELASGEVVYGEQQGVWPDTSEQPAARRVLQLSTSGQGEIVDDNTDKIRMLLGEAGPQPEPPTGNDPVGSAGSSGSMTGEDGSRGSCGCRVPGHANGGGAASLLLLGLAAVLLRARRRTRR